METGKEGGVVKMYLRNLKGGITEQQKFDRKRKKMEKSDQYQYLGNCPPTPPLTQQESIDNKLGLMLG